MAKCKILVVDDSVMMRRLVAKALETDSGMEVVGFAPNGKIALQKIPQCNPDLVTLDVEMPIMDGLETLAAIRKEYPDLPVIMFSTLTSKGTETTMEALLLGASDYSTKPIDVQDLNGGLQVVRGDLIPKIRVLCPGLENTEDRPKESAKVLPVVGRASFNSRIDILAIGVSTGGPNALAKVLPSIPADFPVPIVIVQHMPPVFTGLLAKSLSKQSKIEVCEATDGQPLKAGCAYIAPGDYHMILEGTIQAPRTKLHQGPRVNSCRPAVDVLFQTVSEIYGAHCLSVIMTGMGRDGFRGVEAILEAEGRAFVQDEATSVVWGMPGHVAQAGLAEKVLPLGQLAGAIDQAVRASRGAGLGAARSKLQPYVT